MHVGRFVLFWSVLYWSFTVVHVCVYFKLIFHSFFQIILAGDVKSDDTKALLDVVNSFYLPNKIVIVHRPGTKSFLSEHLQVLDTVTEVDGKATAYVCENYSCKSPVNQPALLKKLLNPKKSY